MSLGSSVLKEQQQIPCELTHLLVLLTLFRAVCYTA